ncbi:MAG: alpha/beta hydrolase [Deltaproteobacteria bacterium]|nr:alpha/beta hydrolase [Deltaproteobacteria bacterium]
MRRFAESPDTPPLSTAVWAPTVRVGRARAPDGTGIHYEVVGQGRNVVLLANGLGGRLYAWRPLLDALWAKYRFVTWDYRGLFHSDCPTSNRRLSLADHVDDARAVLDAEGIGRAALVGWSMGVQVCLDFAATLPSRVTGLVLLNGTYGHVFSTGFQPVLSIPWLPRRLHAIVEWLREHPHLAEYLARVSRTLEWPTAALFILTAGTRSPELIPMLRQYMSDVTGPSFVTYLRLFQELDAHSVYHLLPEIDAPSLVVSGLLDALTPSFQSAHMARRMKRARHLHLVRAGHFALLERPEIVVPAIEAFLHEEGCPA